MKFKYSITGFKVTGLEVEDFHGEAEYSASDVVEILNACRPLIKQLVDICKEVHDEH